jgi:metal-dependent hydrolase (beta-lactamase superfamily II)
MQIPLRPVDGVRITKLMDNSSDALLPDEGLVRRWGMSGSAGPLPVIPNGMSVGGKSVDFLRAEHGFFALIEVSGGAGRCRVLFDAGITPDGLVGNLDRLGGLHLRFGPVVAQTVAALAAEPPDVLVPAHCMSWQAVQTLGRDLPDAFRPNAVGSRFAFEAS